VPVTLHIFPSMAAPAPSSLYFSLPFFLCTNLTSNNYCPNPYEFPLLCLAFLESNSSPRSLYSTPMCWITLGCDHSHPPSYMYSMIGFGNTQLNIRRFMYNSIFGKMS
jgi:hypothetical protein